MIKAVIFDFFGVLATRGATESFRQTHYPGDSEKQKLEEGLIDRLASGAIGYDDFIDGLAKIAGVEREMVLKYTEDYQPNTTLLDYIRDKLKPKYKVGIISNAGADWVLEILGSQNIKLFDDIILSYKVGFIKPDAEIYEMSVKNLGIKPEECVFIDDIMTYCQGAEAVGMNTVWYQSFEQMKSDLEKILQSSK